MVDDYIPGPGSERNAVVFLRRQIAEPASQVTHYYIMRRDHEREVAQTDAISRCGLARNCDVGILDD